MLIPAVSPTSFSANAVLFDGSTYLRKSSGLTGASDGKAGTISVWFNYSSSGGEDNILDTDSTVSGAQFFQIYFRGSDGTVRIKALNSSGTEILNLSTNTSSITTSTWYHVLASWDLSSSAAWMRLNDSSNLASSPTLTDDNIDYTRSFWAIGAEAAGGNKISASLAELWFDDAYITDTEANRRKFISATGKPVYLGRTGQRPTGSQPLIFLSRATSSWHTNKGSGGGFTEQGALTTATTSPSD